MTTQSIVLARLAVAAAVILGVSGCAQSTSEPDAGTGGSDEPAQSETDTGETTSDMLVLPGTGTYVIGVDIPYGGFQLMGEPTEQPAGCTWAILDADGAASFENQGSYVFITDIAEAVTFVTDGCPDWEQFE
jgi:hypothetical protein